MRLGYLYLIMFISTIFLANYLIGNVGYFCDPVCVIPVWPGIYAPSGVLAIGLGFTLRDLVQRHLGVKWTILAVIIGAGLSAYLSPALALASGTAFLLSEMLDLAVYTPLQERNLTGAVMASNMVGLVVDSVAFLTLAFGSLAFLPGQIIGKSLMTLAALPVIWVIRKREEAEG
jgi:queuosine precursor transporter